MPHFGEQAAMLGTLRGEGSVIKRDNALYVTTDVAVDIELREDGFYELREDGSIELRD